MPFSIPFSPNPWLVGKSGKKVTDGVTTPMVRVLTVTVFRQVRWLVPHVRENNVCRVMDYQHKLESSYDPDNSLCVKVDSDPVPVFLSGPEIFVLPWHVQHFSHERAKLNHVHCAMNVSLLFLCLLMSTEARTEWNTTLVRCFSVDRGFYEVR